MQKYDPLEFAQSEVTRFDPIMYDHEQAMDCRDCEECLQNGISSLSSLESAEDEAFDLMESSQMPLERYIQIQEVVYMLYKLWLAKSEYVLRWAAKHEGNRFQVANVAELANCHARAQEWLRVAAGIRENTMTHEELTLCARRCADSAKKSSILAPAPNTQSYCRR